MGMGCSLPAGLSARESGPRVIKLTGEGFAFTGLHALLKASGAQANTDNTLSFLVAF